MSTVDRIFDEEKNRSGLHWPAIDDCGDAFVLMVGHEAVAAYPYGDACEHGTRKDSARQAAVGSRSGFAACGDWRDEQERKRRELAPFDEIDLGTIVVRPSPNVYRVEIALRDRTAGTETVMPVQRSALRDLLTALVHLTSEMHGRDNVPTAGFSEKLGAVVGAAAQAAERSRCEQRTIASDGERVAA